MAFSDSLKMASLAGRVTFPSPGNSNVNDGVGLKQSKTFTTLSVASFPRCSSSKAVVRSAKVVHGGRNSLGSSICYDEAVLKEIIEMPIRDFMREKLEDNLKRDDCYIKGEAHCATCSGSGLYVDPVMKIVKIRCIVCGGSGETMPEERIERLVRTSMPEKVIGDNLKCDDSHSKSGAQCATCSCSGLYVDPIMKIVKIRCLVCGGSGEAIPEERIVTQLPTSTPEKLNKDNLPRDECNAKSDFLCTTCSGSGLYVDPVMKIVKIRCLVCGGSGNTTFSGCGGIGHLGLI